MGRVRYGLTFNEPDVDTSIQQSTKDDQKTH